MFATLRKILASQPSQGSFRELMHFIDEAQTMKPEFTFVKYIDYAQRHISDWPLQTRRTVDKTAITRPSFALVRFLALEDNDYADGELLTLLRKLEGYTLSTLHIKRDRVPPTITETIAKMPSMHTLSELDLSGTTLSNKGIEALISSHHLKQLKNLYLNDCRLTTRAVKQLANTPNLPSLESLHLENNGLRRNTEKILAHCTHLPLLKDLSLYKNPLDEDTDEDVGTYIASSASLTNLTALNMGHTNMGCEGAKALLTSTHLPKLTSLCLDQNDLSGMERIQSPHALERLQKLSLSSCGLSTEEVTALFSSSQPERLKCLDLSYNYILSDGAKLLAELHTLKTLKQLTLACTLIGTEGLQHLLSAEWNQQLEELDMKANRICDKGLAQLTSSPNLA